MINLAVDWHHGKKVTNLTICCTALPLDDIEGGSHHLVKYDVF